MSGERPAYPTTRDVADAREEQLLLSLDGPMPGRVQSYDPATQTADIVPLVRKQVVQPDGEYTMEALPVLPSVPVCHWRAGGAMLSLPIEEGTYGLVIVCAPAIGHWRVGDGDVTDPGDLRRHHMAHAVFLPCGLVPRSEALERTGAAGADGSGKPTGIVLGFDAENGARHLVRANGAVEIETGGATAFKVDANGTVNLGAAAGAAFVALASYVDARLTQIQAAFDAHTHIIAGITAAAGAPIVATNAPPASPIGPLATVAATKARAT